MGTITWWSIEFLAGETGTGYLKMMDGVCQGVYTETGTLIPPEQHIEYITTATDVPAPSWYNPETNTP